MGSERVRARTIAQCDRVSDANVTDASVDVRESFRLATDDAVDAFTTESLDGFHEDGPAQKLAFFVRKPEARWVARGSDRSPLLGIRKHPESKSMQPHLSSVHPPPRESA